MKLAPSGLGAEPKKLALLIGLLVLGPVAYYFQSRSDAPVSANVGAGTTAPAPVPIQPLPSTAAPAAATSGNDKLVPEGALPVDASAPATPRRTPLGSTSDSNDTFVPSLKKKDDLDVSKIDPRINLELLAKVRAVPLEGGASSLFDFSKPPAADTPKVAAITPAPVPVPPPAAKPAAATAQSKQTTTPVASPIPLKYYGFQKSTDGQLGEGLFLEGDPATGNIYSKREGDMIKDRYKVIRIGLRSADLEDMVSHDRQTLKLPEDQQ
jgi:hypothetical protein